MTTDVVVPGAVSQAAPDTPPREQIDAGSGPLRLVLLFLVLEYARPPFIVELRLQMLISLLLPLLWLSAPTKPRHPILIAQMVFVVLCALQVPFVSNNFSAYFTARTMFSNVAVAVAMSWVFSRRDQLAWGIWSWVAIMAYVAAYGVTHGGRGPGGFLGDENDLALGCVTALPFAFFGFEHLGGWRRWVAAAFGTLTTASVVMSFSRGGFVGLAGASLYCWILSRNKLRNLVVLVIAALGILTFAPSSYFDEIRSIRDTSHGTAEGRRFLWETARNMWMDHPLFGVGGGNFMWLAGRYQPNDFQGAEYNERDWSGTTVHSFYFQLLSEQGLVGVAVCGFILVSHFRTLRTLRRAVRDRPQLPAELRRATEIYAPGLSAGMIGFALAGAFLSVVYYPYFWYLSGMAVGLDAAMRRELEHCAA